MSQQDSDTDRELPATERRIQKAREEGNIPRSRELSSGALLLACVLFFWAFGGHFTAAVSGLMQRSLSVGKHDLDGVGTMGARLGDSLIEGFLMLLPLMAFAGLVAILSTLAIGGFNYSEKNYEFKASRINPIAGFARLFSANAAFEVVKAILKVVVIGAIAWTLTVEHINQYTGLITMPIDRGIAWAGQMAVWDSIYMSLAFFLIIAVDAPFQLWKYYRDLRMSLQEVKDEAKESDGDPMLKGRIRQMQRERARSRMMAKVPTADVVVTNPTHYSVALSYSDGNGRAPVVVAKGKGEVALRIRELAAEHKVPTLEMPPLARALYTHVELDREIPSTLFTAVAKLLAYVMTLKAGSLDSNLFPQVADIPDGLDPGPSTA